MNVIFKITTKKKVGYKAIHGLENQRHILV